MKVSKAKENKRSETINLRIESSQKDLIDLATNVTGKTRTAFMLDSAYQKAQETLLDRRLFYLDEKQWQTFNQLLETSPTDNEQLSHLLNHKAPWE